MHGSPAGHGQCCARASNAIGLITGDGLSEVVCGRLLDRWLGDREGQPEPFGPFGAQIEQACGIGSITGTGPERIDSETK